MGDSSWRNRLQWAIDESGKSMRAVSLASGNGPGYVHSILKDSKEPTIDNLASVCDAVPIGLAYVLFGVKIKDEDLTILSLLQDNPDIRETIVAVLKSRRSGS